MSRRLRLLGPGQVAVAARVVGAVGAAALITLVARRFADETMYVFFVAAVQLAAWRDGWRSGVVATGLSVLAVDFLFIEPVGSVRLLSLASAARLLSFTLVSALLLVTTRALRVARQRANELALAATAAQKNAEHVSEARARFLSTLSHEVRTPINAILGYSDLVETIGPVSQEQTRLLERMRLSARHLLSVVNGVLDLAKAEAGHLTVQREPTNLRKPIDAAIAMVSPQAGARRVTIVLRQEQQAIDCLGDADRIRQILVNLLANAVKFSPEDSRIRVTCGVDRQRAATENAPVFVSVTDSGPGIPQPDQERIFVPFEQASGTKNTEGAGLGLAISRQLARLQGGELSLESVEGQGATFTLRLQPAVRPRLSSAASSPRANPPGPVRLDDRTPRAS